MVEPFGKGFAFLGKSTEAVGSVLFSFLTLNWFHLLIVEIAISKKKER